MSCTIIDRLPYTIEGNGLYRLIIGNQNKELIIQEQHVNPNDFCCIDVKCSECVLDYNNIKIILDTPICGFLLLNKGCHCWPINFNPESTLHPDISPIQCKVDFENRLKALKLIYNFNLILKLRSDINI